MTRDLFLDVRSAPEWARRVGEPLYAVPLPIDPDPPGGWRWCPMMERIAYMVARDAGAKRPRWQGVALPGARGRVEVRA